MSATGAEQSSLQGKIVDMTLATVPEALASVINASLRSFYRLAVRTIDAYPADLCYGTEEFKHNICI